MKVLTDDDCDKIYDDQDQFIHARFGEEAAHNANYGWGCTEHDIATKVYKHGVLVSWMSDDGLIQHDFRPF